MNTDNMELLKSVANNPNADSEILSKVIELVDNNQKQQLNLIKKEKEEEKEKQEKYNNDRLNLFAKMEIIKKVNKGFLGAFASLDDVLTIIKPALTENNFFITFKSKTEILSDKNCVMHVTCILKHITGLSESSTVTSTTAKLSKATEVQETGATLTYLRRYVLLLVLGTSASEKDLDAITYTENQLIESADKMKTQQKRAELKKIMRDKNINVEWVKDVAKKLFFSNDNDIKTDSIDIKELDHTQITKIINIAN